MRARRVSLTILGCLLAIACTLLTEPSATAQSQNSSTDVSIGVGETSLVITGITSPNAFITITEGGDISGTVNADIYGDFTHTFPTFTPGIHQISVYAQDTEGRTTDTVTKEVNVTEHFQTNLSFFLPPTLALNSQVLRPGESLQLSGSTIPNGKVTIVLDQTTPYQVTARTDGTWNIKIDSTALTAGSHTLYAFAIDPVSGAQGLASDSHPFTVLGPVSSPSRHTPGLQLPVTILPGPSVPRILSPQTGTTFHDANIVIRGQATPLSRVDLFDKDTPIGSVYADASGEWHLPLTLQSPYYDLRARACIQSKCSAFSSGIQLLYIAPSVAHLSIQADYFWFQATIGKPTTQQLRIQGGTAPYKLIIDWGDGTSAQVITHETMHALTHTYQQGGIFNATVQARDSSNQHAKLAYAVQALAAPDFSQAMPTLLLLMLVTLLLAKLPVRSLIKAYSKNHKRNYLRK